MTHEVDLAGRTLAHYRLVERIGSGDSIHRGAAA
jgi:hypothetical protein